MFTRMYENPLYKHLTPAELAEMKEEEEVMTKMNKARDEEVRLAMKNVVKFEKREFGTIPKELDAELDHHRLRKYSVKGDGCCCIDRTRIPDVTARTLFMFPRLCNFRADDLEVVMLDDLTEFIADIHTATKYSKDQWVFHYGIFYLLHGLALVASEQALTHGDRKPSFIPASTWIRGRDTYFAAFLWVASVYQSRSDRHQQVPSWREFQQISGLSHYQQWQYFEFMDNVLLKPRYRELRLNLIKMLRFGFVQELPIQVGHAWWERGLRLKGSDEDKHRRVSRRRGRWPSEPLPEWKGEVIDDEKVLSQLLPYRSTKRAIDWYDDKFYLYGPTRRSVLGQQTYKEEMSEADKREKRRLDAIIAFEKAEPPVKWSSVKLPKEEKRPEWLFGDRF